MPIRDLVRGCVSRASPELEHCAQACVRKLYKCALDVDNIKGLHASANQATAGEEE